jgi:hypothetical protein
LSSHNEAPVLVLKPQEFRFFFHSIEVTKDQNTTFTLYHLRGARCKRSVRLRPKYTICLETPFPDQWNAHAPWNPWSGNPMAAGNANT